MRELLAEGDVAAAARILGRPHRVVGVVVHGDHRGRELGYPTANLAQDAVGQIPADGVYAGRLVRPTLPPGAPDAVLPAAVSIGTNPTFDGTQRRVEAYVLDRDDLDLYGERVAVEFVERLRPTLRFDGVGPLIEQMAADVDPRPRRPRRPRTHAHPEFLTPAPPRTCVVGADGRGDSVRTLRRCYAGRRRPNGRGPIEPG